MGPVPLPICFLDGLLVNAVRIPIYLLRSIEMW